VTVAQGAVEFPAAGAAVGSGLGGGGDCAPQPIAKMLARQKVRGAIATLVCNMTIWAQASFFLG